VLFNQKNGRLGRLRVGRQSRCAYIKPRQDRPKTKGVTLKAIRRMTLNELIKAKVEIESAIYAVMQADQNRQLKEAMSGIGGLLSTSASRKNQPRRGHLLKGRKLPVRFRNPNNRKETWAGRGHKPRWLVAALKRRSSKLADFAVA